MGCPGYFIFAQRADDSVARSYSAAAPWHRGTGTSGTLGTLGTLALGTLAPWHLGTLVPWHPGTWHSGTLISQSSELATRSRDASRAMTESRFDEAARIYRELLQSLPNDPGLLMNLGMALAMGGHESDAIAPLERAISLNALVPAHLFLGSSYLALDQPQKAIPPLERAVKGAPKDVERRRLLSQAHAAVGRPADAITQLRTITEVEPRIPAAWFALGHAYSSLAQDAMGTFQDAAEDAPWRQLLVADALLADGRLTDAFALYRPDARSAAGHGDHTIRSRRFIQNRACGLGGPRTKAGVLQPRRA